MTIGSFENLVYHLKKRLVHPPTKFYKEIGNLFLFKTKIKPASYIKDTFLLSINKFGFCKPQMHFIKMFYHSLLYNYAFSWYTDFFIFIAIRANIKLGVLIVLKSFSTEPCRLNFTIILTRLLKWIFLSECRPLKILASWRYGLFSPHNKTICIFYWNDSIIQLRINEDLTIWKLLWLYM